MRHTRSVYFIKKAPEGLNPFFLVVDRLESRNPHVYDFLWHVDSENPVITEAGVDLEEMAVCVSGNEKTMEIIRGREEPEWQGYAATGTEQGMYREINCIVARAESDSIRMVTVLYPHGAGEVTACRVYGGENIEDGDMEVAFSDGRAYSFQEAVMRNDHKGGEVS